MMPETQTSSALQKAAARSGHTGAPFSCNDKNYCNARTPPIEAGKKGNLVGAGQRLPEESGPQENVQLGFPDQFLLQVPLSAE